MKCRPTKCEACCCYNVPFDSNELERYADKIVRPVLFTLPTANAVVPFTDNAPNKNKCPFLRYDFKCNIYENRPEVCRLFGEVEQMPCPLQNK